ncbi:MAG: tetratricopeptide repeat protein [Kiritimatiellales bacterium]|nr:tetratricopeptide repeat protein [Kiritimatiellales bacterium]
MQANSLMKPCRRDSIVAILLFLLTTAVFLPALFCRYVAFDDSSYVSKNLHVLSGLSLENLRWAFHVHDGFWSPILWISYMLDSSLLSPEPWAFHLTNILLHSLNAALLFLLLRRTTDRPWVALVAAALWALHPLRVESVVWITERKDVLSGLFLFLSLHAYVSFSRSRHKAQYVLLLLFMVAGLMVKPILITLPVLLLLLDVWPLSNVWKNQGVVTQSLSKHWKNSVVEKIPLFICAAIFTVTGWLAHHSAISSLETYSLLERIGIALHNYAFYIGKMLRPAGLATPYPMMIATVWQAAGAAALLAAITVVALFSIRRAPHLFTGWLWFCIALFPVCGFIQIGNTTTADRFTYLPSIGLTVALVWSVAEIRRIPFQKEIALVAIAGLILLTVRQIAFWRDSNALFGRALSVTGENPVADAMYGGWLTEQGRFDEAEPHLLRAVELFPSYSPAANNLGLLFSYRGDFQRALICFEFAVANPNHSAQAEINLESCRRVLEER